MLSWLILHVFISSQKNGNTKSSTHLVHEGPLLGQFICHKNYFYCYHVMWVSVFKTTIMEPSLFKNLPTPPQIEATLEGEDLGDIFGNRALPERLLALNAKSSALCTASLVINEATYLFRIYDCWFAPITVWNINIAFVLATICRH